MTNLMTGIMEELKRNRELLKIYEDLPDGSGTFGAAFIRRDIELAEKAISEGDTVAMVRFYKALKDNG